MSPNPTTSVVNVTIRQDEVKSVTVTDVLGKTITFDSSFDNDLLSIDLKENKTGLYFINVVKQDDTITSFKVILSE